MGKTAKELEKQLKVVRYAAFEMALVKNHEISNLERKIKELKEEVRRLKLENHQAG